jgi:hypothetical protein
MQSAKLTNMLIYNRWGKGTLVLVGFIVTGDPPITQHKTKMQSCTEGKEKEEEIPEFYFLLGHS